MKSYTVSGNRIKIVIIMHYRLNAMKPRHACVMDKSCAAIIEKIDIL